MTWYEDAAAAEASTAPGAYDLDGPDTGELEDHGWPKHHCEGDCGICRIVREACDEAERLRAES